jgi:hypothetical protein
VHNKWRNIFAGKEERLLAKRRSNAERFKLAKSTEKDERLRCEFLILSTHAFNKNGSLAEYSFKRPPGIYLRPIPKGNKA